MLCVGLFRWGQRWWNIELHYFSTKAMQFIVYVQIFSSYFTWNKPSSEINILMCKVFRDTGNKCDVWCSSKFIYSFTYGCFYNANGQSCYFLIKFDLAHICTVLLERLPADVLELIPEAPACVSLACVLATIQCLWFHHCPTYSN